MAVIQILFIYCLFIYLYKNYLFNHFWKCIEVFYEGINKVNRQPSIPENFNCQPSFKQTIISRQKP